MASTLDSEDLNILGNAKDFRISFVGETLLKSNSVFIIISSHKNQTEWQP